MTLLTVALVSVSLLLFSLPFSLAGPACARRNAGDDACVSRCAGKWTIPGAVMGTDPWGSVMKPLVGPADLADTLAKACGSSTPQSRIQPTMSSQAATQMAQASFPGAAPSVSTASVVLSPSLPNSVSSSSPPSAAVTSTSETQLPLITTITSTSQLQATRPASTLNTVPDSTPTAFPQPPTQNPQPVSGDVNVYLSAHNAVRARHGAAPLTWSDLLASKAQEWANGCVHEHSGGSLGPYGENLAAGTGSGFGIQEAIGLWADEVSSYNPNNPQASHFTQVVWKSTTQLGCASAICNGIFPAHFGPARFFVCEYSPPGNVGGQYVQNVQA